MLHILYIGSAEPGSTSYHRSQALVRLGHKVELSDPYPVAQRLSPSHFTNLFHFNTGYVFVQHRMKRWIMNDHEPSKKKYDLVWVDSGELFGAHCVQLLAKKFGCAVVLYNVDDPTGRRDGRRFASLQKALPYYDLVVVVREETEKECRELGAKKVLLVRRSYDEISHLPFENPEDIPSTLRSEVAFIGTWMRNENRDDFLLRLVENGVPISIWGDRWKKSKHFKRLRPYWKGAAIYNRDYVAAVQGSKVCIGMLSKGNRDRHTTRSLEIPYIGSVFCAERTPDHLAMYKEKSEAVFWNDAEECSALCMDLLADDNQREALRLAGMKKVREIRAGNEDVCKAVLSHLFA